MGGNTMSNQLLLRRRMMMQSKTDNILTFTAAANNSSVQLEAIGTPFHASLEYKTKGNEWLPYTLRDVINLPRTGDYVKMRGVNSAFSTDISNYYKYVFVGSIAASGDVTSLLNGEGGDVALPTPCIFYSLFSQNRTLISAPKLPSTILTQSCYALMFYDTGIIQAPELPAITLTNKCYQEMFYGCMSLSNGIVLPANTLANECYKDMCVGCRSLTYMDYNAFTDDAGLSPNLDYFIVRQTTPADIYSHTIPSGINNIYVPYSEDHSILNSYKTKPYWSAVADKIFELDENGNIPEL